MESSRTHFEVLGLGLEASSPRKLACPRLEDSSIFWIVKILWSAWKIFWENVFLWRSLEKFLWRPFFFWRALALVSMVLGLGLEHSCPWPRKCPVRGKAVLGLGFFLCPWPWPRALCPRLHLWFLSLISCTMYLLCRYKPVCTANTCSVLAWVL